MADEDIIRKMPEMTLASWKAEACARFGSLMRAQFVCPRCGNVAHVMDFEPYKDQGAKADHAATTCIGRWNPDPEVGCDWAAFGLMGTLNGGIRILHPDGKAQLVFDFAPPSLAAQVASFARPTEAIEEMSEDEQVIQTAKEIEGNMMYLGMDDTILDTAEKVGAVEKGYREWRTYGRRVLKEIEKLVETGDLTGSHNTVLVEILQSPDWQPPSSVVPDQEVGAMRESAPATDGGEGESDPGDSPSES